MAVLGYHWDVDPTGVLELDDLARKQIRSYPRRRYLYDELIGVPGRPFVALVGPRGTDLFELARELCDTYGIERLYIDEIHFLADYQRDLKRIHDFLDVAVWFTSSVSLALTAAGWDLSRRVRRVQLPPFSFREYLDLTESTQLPSLALPPASAPL